MPPGVKMPKNDESFPEKETKNYTPRNSMETERTEKNIKKILKKIIKL